MACHCYSDFRRNYNVIKSFHLTSRDVDFCKGASREGGQGGRVTSPGFLCSMLCIKSTCVLRVFQIVYNIVRAFPSHGFQEEKQPSLKSCTECTKCYKGCEVCRVSCSYNTMYSIVNMYV